MQLKSNDWKLWLIESTFTTDNFERPKTSCEFGWKFIASILLIPFAWISHLINLIAKMTIHAGWGLFILFVGMAISASFITGPVDAKTTHFGLFIHEMFSHFSPGEKLLVCYFSAPLTIALLLAAVALFVCIIAFVFIFPYEWIKQKMRVAKYESRNKETNNWFILFYRGIKNKFCVKITYVENEQ